jgi:DNA modification methylase
MIYQSDIVEWLKNYDGPKYHAILSDPPYGLAFMGKSWDTMSSKEFQAWVTEWGSLLLGVVYPGAIGMFFGGTRTFHRLTVGLEDAGWEIFDVCMFLYGSGFPKSHDISKALDREAGAEREVMGVVSGMGKQNPEWNGTAKGRTENYFKPEYNLTAPATPDAHRWQGYGTALKPAYEPIILARAPHAPHTYAALAREFGTGALNVDGARIPANGDVMRRANNVTIGGNGIYQGGRAFETGATDGRRWPSNVILDEHAVAALDEQSGEGGSGTYKPRSNNRTVTQFSPEHGWNQHSMNPNNANAPDDYGDVGGASRFFYTAKAAAWERTAGLSERSKHPTMKPIRLTEYLAKMLLPPIPQNRLLVPFSGVGSEIIGAQLAGWDHIDGIEQDADYCVDAYNRVVWWSQFSSYEEAQKHYKKNKDTDDFSGWS